MRVDIGIGKLFSLATAASYAILAIHWGGAAYWKWSLGLLLPLGLIWFPEESRNLTSRTIAFAAQRVDGQQP